VTGVQTCALPISFVSGWIAQARRHNLPSELIIVEWNPPAGRARLAEALRWPDEFGPCQVRFIVVPPELHGRYRHADALPLYQMIAKNAGIRRAQGRFILATNIDILFSNELMAFLAGQCLQPGRMYRIDRHDTMSDVPPDSGIDEQLEYCRTHLLRINAREGTFPLAMDGRRALAQEDIAGPDSGITFGRGWFPVECYSDGERFRWAYDDAEMEIIGPPEAAPVLDLDLEPGPGIGQSVLTLQVLEEPGTFMTTQIERRSNLRISIGSGGLHQRKIKLRVLGGGDPVANDARILNFRVFSCKWIAPDGKRFGAAPTSIRVKPAPRWKRTLSAWAQLQTLIGRIADGGRLVTVTLPISRPLHRAAVFYVERGGFTGMVRHGCVRVLRWREFRRKTMPGSLQQPEGGPARTLPDPQPVTFLHTNACGDFTLLAREHWFDLRGYPEFDMFSMNIDSVFCYAAHHGGATERVLRDPMRIYHIEHGIGSGWTPEGQAQLFTRIRAKGLSCVPYSDVVGWAAQMRRLNCPLVFNHENWGLEDFQLQESQP